MSDPECKRKHRRRRPAVSCSLCRRRKIRCNRESPCSNCIRSRTETCVYDVSVQLPQHHDDSTSSPQSLVPAAQASRPGAPSTSTSSIQSEPSSGVASRLNSLTLLTSSPLQSTKDTELSTLRAKIRQLESQLQNSGGRAKESGPVDPVSQSIETTTSELAGTFHVQHESRLSDQPHISRSRIVHKTRVFGQSHWSNGIIQFRDIFHIMEPILCKRPSQAAVGLQRCKTLGRFIKAQRSPSWPTPLTSDSLPAKDIADQLVECYLGTMETVYRIVHIPSFRQEYEAFWRSDFTNNTERDRAFQVQLKLVLALGAVFYDDSFSLRASALQWIYEGQAWAAEPEFKPRLNIRFIQNSILLLLARELAGVGGDLIWISAGSLIRTAMYMGLHRDPSRLPNRSLLDSEIHRRVWNTILEISLSGSMSAGGPVLVSIDDFDTMPPGNFDDEQLTTSTLTEQATQHQQRPLPRLDGDFTQSSVMLALRGTFPQRLAIAKFLNDLSSRGTYEETLRLDADLRAGYKILCRTLQQCRESSNNPGNTTTTAASPSQFASRWVDFQMHRFISALHTPFFGPALREAVYAFSRKVVVETSVKIWGAAHPLSSGQSTSSPISASHITADQQQQHEPKQDIDLFARLATSGSGFIRTVSMLASVAIAAELRTQLQEESMCLGPVSLRPDLLAVVHDARAWTLKCHKTGEVNVKGCMLASLIAAQIDGMMRGLERGELAAFLIQAAEEAEVEVLGILEERAAEFVRERLPTGTLGGGGGAVYLDEMGLSGGSSNNTESTPVDLMDGWDFMYQMPEAMFSSAGGIGEGGMMNVEPAMGWMFTHAEA